MVADTISAARLNFRTLLLDGITPIAAYDAVRRSLPGPSFLLESAPGAGELARHSIIGVGSIGELLATGGNVTVTTLAGTQTCTGTAVLDAARLLLRECAPAFVEPAYAPFVGAYGVATFEFAGYFERLTLAERAAHPLPEL